MHLFKKIVLTIAGMTLVNIAQAGVTSSVKPTITETNAEFVYKYLLGEIAGQRGELLLSSQLFLDLAEQTREPALAMRAARIAAYARQPAAALRASNLWVALDPESKEAQKAASQLLIASGNLAQAKPQLEKLLADPKMRAQGFLSLNALLVKHQNKGKVLSLVQDLAKPYPTLPEGHLAIAQSAVLANKPELAKQALKRADQHRPGWPVSAQMHGKLLFNESPNKAIAFYQSFLNKHPDTHSVRIVYARTLLNQKQLDETKKQLLVLKEKNGDNANTLAIVGLIALDLKEYKLADDSLTTALKKDYKDADQLYLYLGRSAEQQKDNKRAMQWYERITGGRYYLDSRTYIAGIIANTQGVDAAIAYLDNLESLTIEQQIVVTQNKANLLLREKRNAEALHLLEQALADNPSSPELLYDHALIAERLGKFILMEQQLSKVIKLRPNSAAAYNALGYSFADRNVKLARARTLIEKAVKLAPNDHYILDSLGWVYYRLNDLNKAKKYLQQAYDVQQDPEIAAHLGEVLWKLGERQKAKQVWRQGLNDHPDNETLLATKQRFH